ncbi:multidrug efflux system outer membrane protein [Chromobacterium alkanivorans]|uniref:efflux transporter outer membrane subunit n=1 Tax=Chromobacterium alkanivorans TaxID=1071719 RepID=UPI0021697C7E|nr:efflux transporter outer membrane subunit [Chromobacterium alkanivorans]MCS3804069.1 multidrug efflux system outer membrane protein [Chromobacterium alkanivorans]MCS3818710.1 multidrug efflux system outer membrane protein [Chromobacterium alkanivorans]MCS3876144.1 multidrug efflux system outer membrane protein [Chromobacterium alkanivorans]
MLKRALIPSLTALALTACAVGPDYSRPKLELPASAQAQSPAIAMDWWKQFHDPVLDQLIAEALQHNQDLAVAAARVDEAAAQAGIARAQLLPALNANAGYQRGRTSTATTTPGAPLVSDVRNAKLTASWELDLWGKLRRGNEAARADFAASRFARDSSTLAIAAQTAQTYFQLRAYDAQLDIAKRTLQSREESLKLQTKRFKGGLISELDQQQAEAEAASARAKVPQIASALEQTESALGVLLGHSPKQLVAGGIQRGQSLDALSAPPEVPAGLSSSLLERRPDIAASEQQLIAANARIGVARAAYFPSISLSGALGSQSLSLDTLFTGPTRTWSFVGNLAAPVFNFGQTGYAVDAASARQKQALAQYQKTVQSAFKDALDALSGYGAAREIQAAQTTQFQALNKSLRLANLRYDNGYASYLDVLDAQRNSFQAELGLVSAKLDQLNAVVGLYKALGGGWEAPAKS